MTSGRDDEMTSLAMAGPRHTPAADPAPVTSHVLSRIYRSGLVWATACGLLATTVATVSVTPHLASALSGLAGTAAAVVFLACGRGVHLLNRSGSWILGVGLFIIQIAVLGGLGSLLAQYRTGLLPIPCAAAIIADSLAWIVGVVVAGRRPQRIYEDPQDHDSSSAETRRTDGARR